MLREPFPGSIQYIVRSGDSLYRIAQRHGISVCGLKLINGLTSNMIYEGLVLNLPGETSLVFACHVVKAGETLCGISCTHNALVGDLMHENGLTSDVVAAGQVLTVPLVQQEPLRDVMDEKGVCCYSARPGIVVDKSQNTLVLFAGGTWLKTYHVELGSGGMGDWELPGDLKTPEGTYYVYQTSRIGSAVRHSPCCSRPGPGGQPHISPVRVAEFPRFSRGGSIEFPPVSAGATAQPQSLGLGLRWLGLSYPNTKDAYRGLQRGLIDWDTYDSIAAATNNGEMPPQHTALGGGIGIHGGSVPDLGSDWTCGCIVLSDYNMDEVCEFVSAVAAEGAQVLCSVLGARSETVR